MFWVSSDDLNRKFRIDRALKKTKTHEFLLDKIGIPFYYVFLIPWINTFISDIIWWNVFGNKNHGIKNYPPK